MAELPPQVAPQVVPCKCCKGEAKLFGVVDFHKNCLDVPEFKELSGIPIYYHRCGRCGFLFTTALDSFSNEDFSRLIYNNRYALVDPDFETDRPNENLKLFTEIFGGTTDLRVLDYGCGSGKTGRLLREAGFRTVDGYDPFVPEFSARPTGRYDIVFSVEVVEHTPDPARTFADMAQFMDTDGILFFTTAPPPPNFDEMGLGWWYIAPRNAHVSIYTAPALTALATTLGLGYAKNVNNVHLMWRRRTPLLDRILARN